MTKNPPVTIYSLTTCGWSKKTKAFFKQHGVDAFVIEYDMAGPDLQRKISAEMRQPRRRRVPVRQDRQARGQGIRPWRRSSGCSRPPDRATEDVMTEQTKTVELYTPEHLPVVAIGQGVPGRARREVPRTSTTTSPTRTSRSASARRCCQRGAAAFPFVKIGDDFIVGYNPDAFTRLLDSRRARGSEGAAGPGVPRAAGQATGEKKELVGVGGFEPPTSRSRTERSTKLSHTPTRRRILPEAGRARYRRPHERPDAASRRPRRRSGAGTVPRPPAPAPTVRPSCAAAP